MEPTNNTKDLVEEEKIIGKVAAEKVPHNEIFLRVYDLSKGLAKIFSKTLIGTQLDGVWHTSIEAFDKEYYFHCGLKCENVGNFGFGVLKERVSLGHTDCTEKSLNEFFFSSESDWNDSTYHPLNNNCNHFTNLLANFLVSKNIPQYILDLPEIVKKSENLSKLFSMTNKSGFQ